MTFRLFPIIILLFVYFSTKASAQEEPSFKYLVEYADKKDSPYSVYEPWEFLSARAIERRQRYGIQVRESDLPVNPGYIQKTLDKGATFHLSSRWLNAAVVVCNENTIGTIKSLPFVNNITKLGPHREVKPAYGPEKLRKGKLEKYNSFYGMGGAQIGMTGGHVLHQLGFAGEGLLIHVQDGGFKSIDKMPSLDSIRNSGRLAHGRDFVQLDNEVNESSSHGSQVLSVMASHMPYVFVGTAPEASYVVSKTEDTKSETWIEELNWVAGAEYADSIGADLINSSLGYTTFNDEAQNWTYESMNGMTTWASAAADSAYARGLIVVNSAGNEGSGNWRYIGSPADAKHTFSIGAVTINQGRASFSSYGPTSDGRIKPNVSAMGQSIVVASTSSEELSFSNGTSFSSPLVCGLVASLWEAFPERSNSEIMEAIENTASQANNPDNSLGYGIPNMYAAFQFLNNRYVIVSEKKPQKMVPYANPVALLPGKLYQEGAFLELTDLYGRVLHSVELEPFGEFIGSSIQLKTDGVPPPYFLNVVSLGED